MAQFILVYTHPTEGERRFELMHGRSYRIGSRPDNDIVIDQKDVSRRHAVLRVHEGSFHITDLDSKNGTFLNGAKTVSETFSCGDMVHLSSARLVIVEVGTGNFSSGTEAILRREDDSGSLLSEETQKFRSEASMEDIVSLLETTASAVRRGSLVDPLVWAVDHLGFDGAVVLYRDEDNSVAMVSSAGDLGGLASNIGVLSRLATEHRLTGAAGTRVRQVDEMGENLLVATVGSDHVLVVRHAGRPPAIGDLRSVISAVSAVLAGGKVMARENSPPACRGITDTADESRFAQEMVGLSLESLVCRTQVEAAAQQRGPVVVFGERGSGCSLAARLIHRRSKGADAPYVVIDLDGADPDTMERRLLSAGEAEAAAESATGGTLVLDHVYRMPGRVWKSIREALETRPGGAQRVTLILNTFAGNGDVAQQLTQLTGFRVDVPSLRRRIGDLPVLICAMLFGAEALGARRPVGFSPAALERLGGWSWPGNIEELRAEVGKALAAAYPGHTVEVEHLSRRLREGGEAHPAISLDLEALAGSDLAGARNTFEAWMIRRALEASDGQQAGAAKRLGISRTGLFKKMRKLGL